MYERAYHPQRGIVKGASRCKAQRWLFYHFQLALTQPCLHLSGNKQESIHSAENWSTCIHSKGLHIKHILMHHVDSTEIITPSRWTICYIIISKSLCISNVRNMQHLQACKRNFVTMAELVVVPSSYGYVIQATEICSFVFEKSKRKKEKKNTQKQTGSCTQAFRTAIQQNPF